MQAMRAILLTTVGLLTGCMASAGDSGKPETGDAMNVEFSIENAAGESTSQFHDGDTVHFVFRVRNADAAPRTFSFTFPPHRVSVYPSNGGDAVWQAFEGRMFPQVMRTEEVPAGESIAFTAEWGLRGIARGTYRVQPEFIGFVRSGDRLARELPAVSINID